MREMFKNYNADLKVYKEIVKEASKKFYSRKSNKAVVVLVLILGILPSLIYCGYAAYVCSSWSRKKKINVDMETLDKEFDDELEDIDNAL